MLQLKDGAGGLFGGKCLRVGIIGMGGFAARHHDTLIRLERRNDLKLVCTCDPALAAFEKQMEDWHFEARGVKVFDDYRAMLAACAGELDFVIVPTPIHLHAQMHAALVDLNIPVYLEKPPTLDYAELETMIAKDTLAVKQTLVAFHFIVEAPRIALKKRLLGGEFGKLQSVTFKSVIPRGKFYFDRNNWAGRLLLGNRIVLDSCFGNAMAHFVHNVLFWAGQKALYDWAQPQSVRAQLYRVHDIQGADTFFVESFTADGVRMRIAMTHAQGTRIGNMEAVHCENATIYFSSGSSVEIHWKNGGIELVSFEPFDGIAENQMAYSYYLQGFAERPATTLEDSRPFVALNNLAYISSGQIHNIPDMLVQEVPIAEKKSCFLAVNGLNEAIDAFLNAGQWPQAQWGGTAGEVVGMKDLPRLRETLESIVVSSPRPTHV